MTKLTVIIAIAILGGLLMFGVLHYRGVAAKQQAQAQCSKGDQQADQDAAAAQHEADMRTLAEAREQLLRAQQERDHAQASAARAVDQATRLQASIDAMRKNDSAVRRWYDEPLPASVREQLRK